MRERVRERQRESERDRESCTTQNRAQILSKIYFPSLRGVATPNPLLMMAVTLSDTLGDLDVIERERERERERF